VAFGQKESRWRPGRVGLDHRFERSGPVRWLAEAWARAGACVCVCVAGWSDRPAAAAKARRGGWWVRCGAAAAGVEQWRALPRAHLTTPTDGRAAL